MAHTLIDIYNHMLKYDDKELYVAINSKQMNHISMLDKYAIC